MTLAHRVAVMEAGEVRQPGTPGEIYDDPANLFVAGFIGSPAMNLVPGDTVGGTFRAEAIAARPLHAGLDRASVVLGVRAEELRLVASGQVAGKTVGLAADAARLSLVDAASGQRIRAAA